MKQTWNLCPGKVNSRKIEMWRTLTRLAFSWTRMIYECVEHFPISFPPPKKKCSSVEGRKRSSCIDTPRYSRFSYNLELEAMVAGVYSFLLRLNFYFVFLNFPPTFLPPFGGAIKGNEQVSETHKPEWKCAVSFAGAFKDHQYLGARRLDTCGSAGSI